MPSRGEVVDQLVRRIVACVDPLRIIVFGSTASGDAQPASDIDLLVVMPDGTHRRKTARKLYVEISGVPLPFDVLVAIPRDLEKHRDNKGLIYRTILQEGTEVYAA
ncbi:MAG: nucleotidyltransferase domain-containing protein [Planctomycetota bacterium]